MRKRVVRLALIGMLVAVVCLLIWYHRRVRFGDADDAVDFATPRSGERDGGVTQRIFGSQVSCNVCAESTKEWITARERARGLTSPARLRFGARYRIRDANVPASRSR